MAQRLLLKLMLSQLQMSPVGSTEFVQRRATYNKDQVKIIVVSILVVSGQINFVPHSSHFKLRHFDGAKNILSIFTLFTHSFVYCIPPSHRFCFTNVALYELLPCGILHSSFFIFKGHAYLNEYVSGSICTQCIDPQILHNIISLNLVLLWELLTFQCYPGDDLASPLSN